MTKKQTVVILFLCAVLSGCGFHLRMHQKQLNHQYPQIQLPLSGSHTLHQAIRRALAASSVHVVESTIAKSSLPPLVVLAEDITTQPLVYGPDNELRRERLRMIVKFSFGKNTPKVFELATERDRMLNSNQHLGDNAEKVLIEQEMQMDIIRQLLRFLANNPKLS